MLKSRNATFNYGDIRVFDNISFNVEKGLLCGLFGPNGCGKTTLFQCCMGFLETKAGNVFLEDRDIGCLRIKEIAKLVAYVPQEHKPPFPYSVNEVVMMGRTPHLSGLFGINHRDREKTLHAMDLVGISGLSGRPYNQLSGGQRQLVLIARAIAQETKLMILDEPTSALDFKNQIQIWKMLRKIVESGTTVFACSHDPNHVAWFCDKVIVMSHKGIVVEGSPVDVFTQQLLDDVYADTCDLHELFGVKIILPDGVSSKKIAKGRNLN